MHINIQINIHKKLKICTSSYHCKAERAKRLWSLCNFNLSSDAESEIPNFIAIFLCVLNNNATRPLSQC